MAKLPISRNAKKKKAGFLPPGAIAFLRRRLVQFAGLGVVGIAGAVATALATWDRADPSFNLAADRPVNNALGAFGAVISDQILQWLGLAGVLGVLVVTVWGARLVLSASPVRRLWLRVLVLMTAVLLSSVGLSSLTLPADWSLPAGAGGAAGYTLLALLTSLQPDLRSVFAFGSFALGMLTLIYAFGLSRQEWHATIEGVKGAGSALGEAGEKLRGMQAADTLKGLGEAGHKLRGLWDRGDDVADHAPPAPATTAAGRPKREPTVARFGEPTIERAAAESAAVPPDRRPAVTDPNAPKPVRAVSGRRENRIRQPDVDLDQAAGGSYSLPPLALLALPPPGGQQRIGEEALTQNAKQLESVLQDFGVNGQIVKVRPGPVVTLYELEPAPGTKTSRVIGLADDIARSMSALSVRIAVIPGRSVIGIEMPNAHRETVYMRELMASESFERAPARLVLALGKDIGGQPVMVDLARMPHLLIAGTTGSGKSVAINTMILSLLYRLPPEECRMIMIDPKMLELSVYDGIPHLLAPVVTEPGKAVVALKWAVREMEDRYRAMSQLGVRNITGYNQRLAEARTKAENLTRTVQTGFDPESGKPVYEEQGLNLDPLPYIVVVVDEMADLMLVAGKDIEAAVQRLAQMARAAGIHLIMATQRPSVDVITGTIKANFPTRISFQVSSKIDSRTILGEQGAEQLLGQGDMLYMAAGGRITRVHGPFVSDQEVEEVVNHLRSQGEPSYIEAVTEEEEEAASGGGEAARGESGDALYDQAVALVAREGKASTSFIQRHLQIGYNRAARIIERMEADGVVSRANHVGKREVLVRSTAEDY